MLVNAIKATAYELDVLGCPFGGPENGRDSAGEFFDSATKFHEDAIPLPPVLYYHGFTPDNRPAGTPEWIGKTIRRWVDQAGVWYRVALEKGNQFAERVWHAANATPPNAKASSGTMAHLRRVAPDGHIDHWVVSELSLFDTGPRRQPCNQYAVVLPAAKFFYQAIGVPVGIGTRKNDSIKLDLGPRSRRPVVIKHSIKTRSTDVEDDKDTQEQAIQEAIREAFDAGMKAAAPAVIPGDQIKRLVQQQIDAAAAAQKAAETEERKRQEDIATAVKAATADLQLQLDEAKVASRRLSYGAWGTQAPTTTKFAALRPYDGMVAADAATMIAVLQSAKATGASRYGASEDAMRALAIKLDEDRGSIGAAGQSAMKAVGIKANEVMTSTMANYGDEWIGQAYSTALWEQIRLETFVVDLLKPVDIPQGMESITLPTEGTDPTFYAVGQTTDVDSTGWPTATVPATKTGTGNRVLSPGKLGCRVLWEGELEEDSIIPFAAQLRSQIGTAGAEYLEHVAIDGDTVMTAATNINNSGTADTPYSAGVAKAPYTIFDGFRKLALVTNTANSRAGAALAETDFLETVKLMGLNGRNAVDKNKVLFIIDPALNYKAIQLTAVRTRDLNSNMTIETGNLSMIWGYKVKVSGQMCRFGGGLTTASGKVDQVAPANNTKGTLLAVRPDQWAFGRKRAIKLETTRIAHADAYEIVAFLRVALIARDLEATALTYNLTV